VAEPAEALTHVCAHIHQAALRGALGFGTLAPV
jgi:hypothetical protein